MFQVHVPQYNPKALETIVVAAQSRKIQHLIAEAVDSTGLQLQTVHSTQRFLEAFLDGGFRLAVLELALANGEIEGVLSDINRVYPHVGVILIARDDEEARDPGLEVGACVHHLFIGPPSVEHLRAFLLALQTDQRRRLETPLTRNLFPTETN